MFTALVFTNNDHMYVSFLFRIVAFQDSWPKLDKWFTRFGTLKRVEAADNPEQVYLEVEKILEDTVNKVRSPSAPFSTLPSHPWLLLSYQWKMLTVKASMFYPAVHHFVRNLLWQKC
jgi:hypothetical protein